MTKRFWAGMMIFSLLIAAGASAFVYVRLQERAMVEIPLGNEPASPRPPETDGPDPASEGAETAGVSISTVPATVVANGDLEEGDPERAPVEEAPAAMDERNILFTFFSSTAKEVAIIGDFTDWFRQPLRRRAGNRWTRAVKLKPGRYAYMFVVDDRRVPDPNAKETTTDGRSVLVVEPLSSDSAS